MRIVSYVANKSILTVGFKEDNFIVYSSIVNDTTKEKHQLIQLAYERVKQTVDYEKTLNEHSLTTDEIGEEFVPEESIVNKILLSIDRVYIQFEEGQETLIVTPTVICKDQYGDDIETEPMYTTSYGNIQNELLEIPKVEEYTEITLIARIGELSDSKIIYVTPYLIPQPSELIILNGRMQELEGTIDIIIGGELIV